MPRLAGGSGKGIHKELEFLWPLRVAENSEGADKTELFADSQQKECRPNTDIPKAIFVLNVSD